MDLKVLAFGIAKDILGCAETIVTLNDEHPTVATLKDRLEAEYHGLGELASYAIAVNNEYAGEEQTLSETDEVAIIPPVSGG